MGRFCLIGSQWWFSLYKFTIYCNLINTCIKLLDNLESLKAKKIKLTLANISTMLSTFGACCSSDFSILPVRATRACSIWTWLNGYHWLRPWAPNSWRATSIPCMTPRPNAMVRTIWGSVETFSKSSVGICLRVDTIAGEEKRQKDSQSFNVKNRAIYKENFRKKRWNKKEKMWYTCSFTWPSLEHIQ